MTEAAQAEGTPVLDAPETEQTPVTEPEGKEQETTTEQPKEPKPEPEKKLKGVGKRLHQLTSERDYWRNLAQQAPQEAPKQETTQEPLKTLKDFEYDEGKFATYLFERAEKTAAEVARREASKWREEQQQASQSESYEERAAEYAETVDDFYDAVNTPNWACSQPMAEVIRASEDGPAVAYYLAKNPNVALRLAQLSGPVAAKELGRIEERLAGERAKAKQKSVSNAPPPPPKIEGSDPGNVEKDPSKMTDAQFRKWREQTMARRRS